MSFFNPLNPALQRELGSLTYGRASVFPGRLSELDEEDQDRSQQSFRASKSTFQRNLNGFEWI